MRVLSLIELEGEFGGVMLENGEVHGTPRARFLLKSLWRDRRQESVPDYFQRLAERTPVSYFLGLTTLPDGYTAQRAYEVLRLEAEDVQR